MPRRMSEKTYVKHGGLNCPFCHSEESVSSVDQMDVDGDIGMQVVKCHRCGKQWTDKWSLVGYSADE